MDVSLEDQLHDRLNGFKPSNPLISKMELKKLLGNLQDLRIETQKQDSNIDYLKSERKRILAKWSYAIERLELVKKATSRLVEGIGNAVKDSKADQMECRKELYKP